MADMGYVLKTLDTLVQELRNRLSDIQLYDDYYRGKHPLRFASQEFARNFGDRYTHFADNWTQVVADAPTERLSAMGIRLAGTSPGEAEFRSGDLELADIWAANEADAMSDMAWLDAIIAKRAFALVWGDPDTDEPVISWEHPSQAIVGYDPGTRKRRAALKLWADGDKEYATLFLPTEVYKFERSRIDDSGRTPAGVYVPSGLGDRDWKPRQDSGDKSWPLPNPLGVVPMVEAVNRPRLHGEPLSDVSGTVAMQDAINLMWAYLFNAGDFASLPQRVLLGTEPPKVPVLDNNGQVVGSKLLPIEEFMHKRIAVFSSPDAKIAEWSPANLEVFTKVIETQVGHIAAQTRTPQHYLIGKMANLSGDALKAAETGLVKRTEEKSVSFGRAVKEIFALCCLVQDNEAKAKQCRRGTVLWKDIESRSEAQLVDGLLKMKQMGFPLRYLAERYGLSPAEVERVMEMRQEEIESDPLLAMGRDEPMTEPGGVAGNDPNREDGDE